MPHARLALLALAACSSGPRSLFNGKNLDGWYSWTASHGKDNDTIGMFAVEDGTIHILGVDLQPGQFEFGYLATTEEFENYRAHFEYQWGTRRFVGFGPDSGFFVNAVGPDMIWPRSLECQVFAGDTGSVYLFDFATIATTIDPAQQAPTYLEGGVDYIAPRNAEPNYARITHSAAYDSATDWNAVDVTVRGADAVFEVNGNVTFRGTALKQPDPAFPDDPTHDVPLTKGRIVLQQEGSEIRYRNIQVEPL